jgi:hypothetical protein
VRLGTDLIKDARVIEAADSLSLSQLRLSE